MLLSRKFFRSDFGDDFLVPESQVDEDIFLYCALLILCRVKRKFTCKLSMNASGVSTVSIFVSEKVSRKYYKGEKSIF